MVMASFVLLFGVLFYNGPTLGECGKFRGHDSDACYERQVKVETKNPSRPTTIEK